MVIKGLFPLSAFSLNPLKFLTDNSGGLELISLAAHPTSPLLWVLGSLIWRNLDVSSLEPHPLPRVKTNCVFPESTHRGTGASSTMMYYSLLRPAGFALAHGIRHMPRSLAFQEWVP